MTVVDQIMSLAEQVRNLTARVQKLEAEEAREAKEGTIRPGVKRGRKPKSGD